MESLTELFCLMDDFCQVFEPEWKKHILTTGERQRDRAASLCLSELMTLTVLFHQLRFRQFKAFYFHYLKPFLRAEFPSLPSYQRLVELLPRTLPALSALFHQLKGQCTGVSIVDSTPIAVCDNLRIKRHKVFADLAQRGKSSTGWFFGFKLHAIINHCGELLAIKVTPGNVDDRKPIPEMSDGLFGKLLADKGYLAKWLSAELEAKGISLLSRVRKNMKKVMLDPFDEALLRRRAVVETVFDELKNLCQIEHSRHRSVNNFMVNLISGIVAYCLSPNKPKIAIGSTLPVMA
jgi:transposase